MISGPPRKAKCSCQPGYSGETCEISQCDFCKNGQCSLHEGMPSCECDPGWTGQHCDEQKCHSGDPNCGCQPGYHGANCEHNVCENYCHKGECELQDGEAICTCPIGYSGDRCQHNKCDHYCHRGTCSATKDGVTCLCQEGYTGKRCNVTVPPSPCIPNPCQNGGECVLVHGEGLCRCPLEFANDKCQERVYGRPNPCASLTCLHGGVCQWKGMSSSISAVCRCMEGWAGENCGDQTACRDNWCFNGGTCRPNPDPTLQNTCECPDGYFGLRCESLEDESLKISQDSSANTATIIIGIFVAVVVLVVAVVVAWLWQRQRAKGISHVRLEENGGTVEMTNPMYLHASGDQEDDPNPVFSLHDSPNTFKNPVYDSLYNEAAAAAPLTLEEKTGLLQSDPLGALDTNRQTGSKS